MNNDAELIRALERARVRLLERRQRVDETEGFAIKHNIQAANLIIGSYQQDRTLVKVQRELATMIIDRANQKEKIKL